MNAKTLFLFLFTLLCTLPLFVLSVNTSDFKKKHLKIKGDQYYPPYEFLNENGEPDGFNVELIRAIADELELEYTIELGPWKTVREELESGEIDLLMGILISEERSEKLIFGLPHNLVTHGIFTHKSKTFNTLESLRGKQIIVQEKDIMHDYLVKNKFTDHIIAVGSQLEALQLLSEGHYDAALMANYQGFHLINEHNLKNVKLRSSGLQVYKYAIATNSHNEGLIQLMNQGLYQLKTDGTFDELHKKWFAVYEENYYFHKYKVLIFSLIGAVLLLAVFFSLLRIRVKRAVRKLHESESLFKNLIEAAPVGIVIYDRNQDTVLTNKKFEDMFGYTMADHANVEDWWPLAYPDEQYRKSVKEYWDKASAEAIKNKRGIPSREFAITRKDGRICHAEIGFTSMGNFNMVTFSDITRRKNMETALRESEEKFSKAFNSSPDVVIISDMQTGKILDVNESILRIGGFTKEETIGRSTIELGFWKNLEDRKRYVEKLLESQRVLSFETVFIRKDGSKIYGLISGEIIQIKHKNYVLSVIKDITHLKEIENELKESEKNLRKLNATKDMFFSIIAHDLRSPFNAMIGFSELLLEAAENMNKNEITNYSSIIQKTAAQTLTLLDNLLLWSRIQQGRMEFVPKILDFSSVLSTSMETVSGNMFQKQISMKTKIEPGFSLPADENMLLVILRNLLSNAIKFTPKGGIITISTWRRDKQICFSVADTGVGMTDKQISALFSNNNESSTVGTAKEKGAGLGLLLTKEFVDYHNGSICIESKKGAGTTFTILLPDTLNHKNLIV
jgi:PAS domain S-box-containing protein